MVITIDSGTLLGVAAIIGGSFLIYHAPTIIRETAGRNLYNIVYDKWVSFKNIGKAKRAMKVFSKQCPMCLSDIDVESSEFDEGFIWYKCGSRYTTDDQICCDKNQYPVRFHKVEFPQINIKNVEKYLDKSFYESRLFEQDHPCKEIAKLKSLINYIKNKEND